MDGCEKDDAESSEDLVSETKADTSEDDKQASDEVKLSNEMLRLLLSIDRNVISVSKVTSLQDHSLRVFSRIALWVCCVLS